MNIKRVWFVSHYSMPPEYEMRIKTQMYARYLGEKGIDCTIFSASTIHNTDINLINGKNLYIKRQYQGLEFVHIKCSNYKKTGIKRIINMLQFSLRFSKVADDFILPDVIVADTNCISFKPIYHYCKKNNIKIVLDVRDLWPLSIVEYYRINPSNLLIKYLYKREETMYKKADIITFSMEGAYEYLKDRGLESIILDGKVFCINNGVDLKSFNHNRDNYILNDPDLDNNDLYKIVYTGSIRKANNLDIILDTAKLINDNNVVFLIWGTGDYEDKLKNRIIDENIKNVIIKGWIDKKYIPSILCRADLNLNHNYSSPLFRYGISFNKLFDYMAAQKPILTTFVCAFNPLESCGYSYSVSQQTPAQIAEMIKTIRLRSYEDCNRDEETIECYDYRVLAERLLSIMTDEL